MSSITVNIEEDVEEQNTIVYPNITTMVFEGGGVKGVSYIGALKCLEQYCGYYSNAYRFAGTSIGSIVAVLLSLKVSLDDIAEMAMRTSSETFKSGSRFIMYFELLSLFSDYGYFETKRIEDIINRAIHCRTGKSTLTFKELYETLGTELVTVTSNITTCTTQYCDRFKTPDLSIALAVSMSCAVPGLFKAVRTTVTCDACDPINDCDPINVFVDGGLTDNIPNVSYFEDDNTLYFIFKREQKQYIISNPYTYLASLMRTAVYHSWSMSGKYVTRQHCVIIDTHGIDADEYNISNEMKRELILHGETASLLFLERNGLLPDE
jgi:NTE family protein